MKAPARKSDKNSKPAAKATKGRASATTASTAKGASSKTAAAKAPAKKEVVAKAKPAAKVAPVKPAAKKAAPVAKKAAPAAKKAATPAKAPASKTAAKAVAPAPKAKAAAPVKTSAKAAPAKASVKTEEPKAKAKPAAAKMPVQANPTPADNPVVVVQDARGEELATVVAVPQPMGKRAVRKAMMEQMMQPEMVPTHAPDAPKATFTHSTERLMTPPLPTAIKKDPKRANNWKTLSVEELTDQDVLAMPDGEYMNDVQQAFFRRKLQLLKADMLANAGETTEHLREDTVVVPDPADRATIEEEHALELRTRDRERKLLKKIEQAIARIDAGDYGYCDETGEPIGVARLMARPTASLSLEAQQRRELKQKMFGD